MLTKSDVIDIGHELFPRVPMDILEIGVDEYLKLVPEILTYDNKEELISEGKKVLQTSYFKRELVKVRKSLGK